MGDKDTKHINDNQELLNKYWNGQRVYCLVAMSGGYLAQKWSEKTSKERESAFIDQLSAYFNKLIPSNDRNGCDVVRDCFVEYIDALWTESGPFDIFPAGAGLHHFEISKERQNDFIFENVHFV